jgi:uncharacterized sporulation protein YeaH/YhbH (DUF444 family)
MTIEAMKQLRDVHSIQGRDGCWDIDDYMLGLYNGLELALSIMEQRDVKYKTRKETSQPKREWVGLTLEELSAIWDSMETWNSTSAQHFYNAIWKAIKEKNNV